MDQTTLSDRSRVFVGLPAYNEEEALPQQAQGQPVNFEHVGSALMGQEIKGGRV